MSTVSLHHCKVTMYMVTTCVYCISVTMYNNVYTRHLLTAACTALYWAADRVSELPPGRPVQGVYITAVRCTGCSLYRAGNTLTLGTTPHPMNFSIKSYTQIKLEINLGIEQPARAQQMLLLWTLPAPSPSHIPPSPRRSSYSDIRVEHERGGAGVS